MHNIALCISFSGFSDSQSDEIINAMQAMLNQYPSFTREIMRDWMREIG